MKFGNFTVSRGLKRKLRKSNRILTQNLLGQKAEFSFNPVQREIDFSQDYPEGSIKGVYKYDEVGRVNEYSVDTFDMTAAQAVVKNEKATKLGSFEFKIKKGPKNFRKHVSDFGQIGLGNTYIDIQDRGLATQNGNEMAAFLDDQLRGIAPGNLSTIVSYGDNSISGFA
jgi:hypothetical protein